MRRAEPRRGQLHPQVVQIIWHRLGQVEEDHLAKIIDPLSSMVFSTGQGCLIGRGCAYMSVAKTETLSPLFALIQGWCQMGSSTFNPCSPQVGEAGVVH